MANSTISPNMLLVIPTVGQDPGPQWATDIDTSLGLIDGHNHTPGSGVLIPPGGLNINSDLPINGNNLTLIRSSRYQAQPAPLAMPSDIGALYVSGVDLYYNDVNGNQIRLTQSGSIVGTAGSITGLVPPASASYSSGTGTFIFQSNTNTSANIDGASFLLRNQVANSKALTLEPPAAMSSDFAIVLPNLPGANAFLQIDNSGNMSASIGVTGGLTSANIASRTIVTDNIAIPVVSLSTTSGTFATSSPFYQGVMAVSLTATGNPLHIMMVQDGGVADAFFGGNSNLNFRVVRDGSVNLSNVNLQASGYANWPPSAVSFIDIPSPGPVSYQLQVSSGDGGTVEVDFCKLLVYEIR